MAGTPVNLAAGTDRATAMKVVKTCVSWNPKMSPAAKKAVGIFGLLLAALIFFVSLYGGRPGTGCGDPDKVSNSTGQTCTNRAGRGAYIGTTYEHGFRPWVLIIGIGVALAIAALTWWGLRSGRYPTEEEALAFEKNVAAWRARIATENPALLTNFDTEVADTRAFNRILPPPPQGQSPNAVQKGSR